MRSRCRALGVAGLLVATARPAVAAAPDTLSDGRPVMGTVLEVTLATGPDAQAARRILEGLFESAARLEALFSRFEPESALSRLNRAAGLGPRRVDPHLARILAQSIAYAHTTQGSFDVTVEPLVRLWQEAARRDALPTDAALAGSLARVSARHLAAQPPDVVEILRPGTSIDLGGIAKGYALDRMVERLRAEGRQSALLSFGQSSVWALGEPADASGWRVLVRGPGEEFLGVATLRDRALSVSGSLGQWSEIEGRRYGHVIDPRTGQPLTRRAQAVVIAPTASSAEALSTALLILGEREGMALLEAEPGVEGLLVDAAGARWTTSGWQVATAFARADPMRRTAAAPAEN